MLTLCLIAPGDLAILMAGTTQDADTQGWPLNRSADMSVLLSWEEPTQYSRHPRGTAI